MNRLTEEDDQGNWILKGINWQQLYAGQIITEEVREKLYGALYKLLDYENTGLDPDDVEGLKEENRWIPTSDRLPKERESIFAKFKGTDKWNPAMFERTSGKVLVTVEYTNKERITQIAHTNDGNWRMDVSLGGNIIAWMPLPEPYREI